MGWDIYSRSTNPSMTERKNFIVNDWNSAKDATVLKATTRGSHVHVLVQRTTEDGNATIFPMTYLTKYKNHELLIKDISPVGYQLDYPLSWIDSITDSTYTREELDSWKDRIRSHNVKRAWLKDKATIGKTITINNTIYTLTMIPLRGKNKLYWLNDNNSYYPMQQIPDEVVPVA